MQDDDEFKLVFKRHERLVILISRSFSRSSKVPYEDFYSELSECLWKCSEKFKAGGTASFETYLAISLKRKAVNVAKSRYAGYYKRAEDIPRNKTDDESESDTPISETTLTDGITTEDRAIERERKKKVAVIHDHLLRSSQTKFGSALTAIIAELSDYESPYALEKANGLARHSVSRKLPALRRFYDANRFGDIREVLIG